MNEASINTCKAAREWTWKDRFRSKLFPRQVCTLPEAPPSWKDVFVNNTTIHLSVVDRFRTLISGKLVVSSKTVCENEIGQHKTTSVTFVDL